VEAEEVGNDGYVWSDIRSGGIAPVATNLLFFDNPEVRPIPKLVVGQ
jgi:hypothetical protein